jgi:S-adenosylmethionine-dependent methyltransferase
MAERDYAFAPAVDRWVQSLGSVRDVVRQELVARQLRRHLPPANAGTPVGVVDVGCGQGTQAIRLAADGYVVTGVDSSAHLLELAARAAAAEPEDVRRRLDWRCADLFGFAVEHRGRFDVVCCHGVLMYLPSRQQAVNVLVSLANADGLVSILSRNQAGIAMRAGMSGQWRAALDGFDADRYTNRLGVSGARADRPEEVLTALDAAGADPVAWYGVRLFTDHWDTQPAPEHIGELLDAEDQAGARDPYRQLAALTHTLARRRG